METIAIVLLSGFVLSAAWKWGESKWICIFQVLQLYKEKVDSTFSKEKANVYNYQYNDALMARKARHKFTAFMIAILAILSYAFIGLTWAAFWCFLINWAVFWILDFLLNIFIKENIWKLGTTAWFDKFKFRYRFVLLLLFVSGLIFLSGCEMVFNKPGADPELKQADTSFINDTVSLKNTSVTGNTESFVFLFRVPATDPEGEQLKFTIVSQPVRGMFSINALGDMYISKSMLDKIQTWYGKKLDVVVAVSDGINVSKATMTFIVEKDPNGRHYLKRNIA